MRRSILRCAWCGKRIGRRGVWLEVGDRVTCFTLESGRQTCGDVFASPSIEDERIPPRPITVDVGE